MHRIHLLVYVVFAGVVTILAGIAGAILVLDAMLRKFTKRADYFKNPSWPST